MSPLYLEFCSSMHASGMAWRQDHVYILIVVGSRSSRDRSLLVPPDDHPAISDCGMSNGPNILCSHWQEQSSEITVNKAGSSSPSRAPFNHTHCWHFQCYDPLDLADTSPTRPAMVLCGANLKLYQVKGREMGVEDPDMTRSLMTIFRGSCQWLNINDVSLP